MERSNVEVTGWRPNEGDSISGHVTELTRGWSNESNSFYPIVSIRRPDGTVTNVHCFHAVLRNRLADIRPKPGDRLTITYMGKKPSKDGRREIAIYKIDAPDRVQDAKAFWDAAEPQSAPPLTSGSTEKAEDDIPF